MKKCSSCNRNNSDKNNFCINCGNKLSIKNICPYCNREVKIQDAFCKYCGKNLKHYKNKIFNNKWVKRVFSKRDPLTVAIVSIASIAILALIIIPSVMLYDIFSDQDEKISTNSHFGEVTVCESIDEDTYAPISKNEEFKIGFREIYATIHISGVSSEDYFTYRWKYADSGEVIREFSFDYFKEEGYIPDYFIIPEGEDIADYHIFSEPGEYIVDFFHNGQYIGNANFKVLN